jgi:hypothetical protein
MGMNFYDSKLYFLLFPLINLISKLYKFLKFTGMYETAGPLEEIDFWKARNQNLRVRFRFRFLLINSN